MPDVLIIESPNKIKKISPHVKGARILATVGHYRDLPDGEMGVDLDTLEPKFVLLKGKKTISDELRKAAEGNTVYIGTDPDREGYAIGTHVYGDVKKKAVAVHRLEIREITEKGIKEAFAKAVLFSKSNNTSTTLSWTPSRRSLVGYLSPRSRKALLGNTRLAGYKARVRLVVERSASPVVRARAVGYPYPSREVQVEFKAFHAGGTSRTRPRRCGAGQSAAGEDRHGDQRRGAGHAAIAQTPFTTPISNPRPARTEVRHRPTWRWRRTCSRPRITYTVGFGPDRRRVHRGDPQQIAASYGPLPAAAPGSINRRRPKRGHEAVRPTEMHPLSDCASVVAAEALRRSRMLYEKSQRTIASQMSDVLYDSTVLTFDCAGEFFKAKGADPLRGVSQGLQRCEEEKADRIPRRNANPEDEEQSFRRWTGRGVPKIGEELEEKQTRPPCATRRNPR